MSIVERLERCCEDAMTGNDFWLDRRIDIRDNRIGYGRKIGLANMFA